MKALAPLLALCFLLPAWADDDLELLKQRGVNTETAALCRVLTDLRPSAELTARIKAAVADLGKRSYQAREKASASLAQIGQPARTALEALKDAEDLEVRYRVRSLLEYLASGESLVTISAAARVLGKRKAGEAFEPLLVAIAHAPSEDVARAAEKALRQVAVEANLPALRTRLGDEQVTVRAAVARVISYVSKDRETELPLLKPLLTDKRTTLRLAAAEAAARLGSTECIAPLLDLLQHEDVMVRAQANTLLRRATGKDHKFVAYDEAPGRTAAVKRWRDWVTAQKGDIAIQKVLADPLGAHHGRILYCSLSPNQVVELDPSGKEARKITSMHYPWGLAVRRDGRRVVCEYSRRRLIEYDVKGKKVWEYAGLPNGPQGICVLPNGNILVACASADTIVEIDRNKKKQVWSRKVPGRPCSVQMLPNGRMLVALQRSGKVVEIDRAGKEHWSKAGLRYPMSAKRLPNGNTLIAEMSMHRVIEVNRAGKTVWTSPRVSSPYDAERLPNGKTVIAHRMGLTEYDKAGKKGRSWTGRNVTRVVSW